MLQTGTWNHSGSLSLRRGEYITEVRGRGGRPPNLAFWLTITTSEDQCATMGDQDAANSTEPAFVLRAKPEHEIVNFLLNANGEIADIEQRQLPPSRLKQPGETTPRDQTPRSGQLSQRGPSFISAGSAASAISRIKSAITSMA